MSVVRDIVATWRNPPGPVGRLLSDGPREDRLLAILIGACLMMFVARLPELARAAVIDPSVTREARFAITFFAILFMVPLLAYAIALLSHLALRAMGRRGGAGGGRAALFWALLASAPGMLLQGLLAGLAGPDEAGTRLVGLLVFVAFLWFWGRGLAVAYPKGVDP